jgi:hypothetical protein
MATVFWDRKGALMVEFKQQGTTMMSEVYWKTLKKLCRVIQNKRCGMLTCSAPPWQCVSTYSCSHSSAAEAFQLGVKTTLLTALISHWKTITCLSTWRTGSDHSASTIMRSSWKVSKHGWPHRLHTSLTQAYKNFFPDMTSASVPSVTTLRSSLRIYKFFVYDKTFFSSLLLVLLTAHRGLLSE